MKITSIRINKFRGFQNISFEVGKRITVIAGQNGTQKTTLLGLLTQPFSITQKASSLYSEKPLCGGNYKSAFSEKFKLSEEFDKPKHHEWTLYLDQNLEPFTIESIRRNNKSIRFWKKNDKSSGSGYLEMPVIFLSLSRLFPVGEVKGIRESADLHLSADEYKLYVKWHNEILIMPGLEISKIPVLKGGNKTTAGINTSDYDWRMNSAGQDNIGKILLAILSFKRLKEKFPQDYKGGILAIDELDATLYPAAQTKLFEKLLHFASKLDLQIFCTTHSLSILESSCQHRSPDIKTIFLEKEDGNIYVQEIGSFSSIKDKLNVTLTLQKKSNWKINLFTEDEETYFFFSGLLKSEIKYFNYVHCSLGCGNLIELARKKVLGFRNKESFIVLDGDAVNLKSKQIEDISKCKNIIILPGKDSPERILADFLHTKKDQDPIWEALCQNYRKQVAFRDYLIEDIRDDRDKAKKWFNSQKQYWGRNGKKLIEAWAKENSTTVTKFVKEVMSKIEKQRG